MMGSSAFLKTGFSTDFVAEFNFSPGEVNVTGKNPKMTGVDGVRDFLSAVSIAPRLTHGFSDLFGGNEVLLHQREFFA